jgi:hypothetical protein
MTQASKAGPSFMNQLNASPPIPRRPVGRDARHPEKKDPCGSHHMAIGKHLISM